MRPSVPFTSLLLGSLIAVACDAGHPLVADADCGDGAGDGPPGIALTVAVHVRGFDSGTLDEYRLVDGELAWLASWADRHDLRLEVALNGYHAEGALAEDQQARFAALAAAGHGFGVHHHPTAREAPLTWVSVGDDPDDDALQRSVDDHRQWVGDALDPLGIDYPGGHVRLTGRSPWWYGMMLDAGYATETVDAWIAAASGGAETTRAFDVMHPLRWEVGGPEGSLLPDPSVPFVALPQHPQVGALAVGEHGGFDGSVERLQTLLLLAYLEWREAALSGATRPPFVFAVTVHPERGAAHNDDLERLATFVGERLAAPAARARARSVCAATRDDVVSAFEAWERAHPGETPFRFEPGDPYPYRLPQLELAHTAHLVAWHDDLAPAALRVAELRDHDVDGAATLDDLVPGPRMLLAWAELADDTVALELSDWTDGGADVHDRDGLREEDARGVIAVGREPLLLVLD